MPTAEALVGTERFEHVRSVFKQSSSNRGISSSSGSEYNLPSAMKFLFTLAFVLLVLAVVCVFGQGQSQSRHTCLNLSPVLGHQDASISLAFPNLHFTSPTTRS